MARVNVLACEPEWDALAKTLGGDLVSSTSATTAFQDPHHIEAKPSLIAKARNADLIICTGAELEVGWLPLLLRQSGNPKIQAGKPGHLMAATHVEKLEVPKTVDRSMGDVHASGNPHVHLDPHRLLTIAEVLARRLSAIDPDNADQYRQGLTTFTESWKLATARWENAAEALREKNVVIHHRNFSYLLNWLGIRAVADLEPKPGLPPSSRHLSSLLVDIKQNRPDFITIAAHQNDRGARWLAKRTGLPVVVLPYTIGGNAKAHSLISLFDHTIDLLLKAGDNNG